jgi:Carboxypeptidase regulatory-like domain
LNANAYSALHEGSKGKGLSLSNSLRGRESLALKREINWENAMKGARQGSVFVLWLVSAVCFAQNTNSGDIRGTVTDTTGAVIPGVKVEVRDVDKGVVKTYVTNGAGLYDTGSITPDRYLLTFTKTGFGTFVRGPITLDVSIQTIDANLKVGSTQEVVVNTDVPLLNTETGSLEATCGTAPPRPMAAPN